MNLPKIAIVGRPNVGKSSLFNRIVGARRSIVEPSSGTTRDRLHADIRWKGKGLTIIDTAGFEGTRHGDMAELVLKQIRKGIEEADIIFFVTDGIAGIAPQDRELSSMLRRTSKRIYLIVNKVDNESDMQKTLEFFELGLGEPYAVSAMHGRGIERLCNDLAKGMEKYAMKNIPELVSPVRRSLSNGVKAAIIGRPNVGKSSYLNYILSEERVIVHPTAGTTRDAVDTNFNYKDREYVLIDTAGIRHSAKIEEAADFYGSVRSKEAVKRCDVAMVLLDGPEGLTRDDARIIDLCLEEGKALVIAVNKWDLVKESMEMSKYDGRLKEGMRVIRNFPVVFTSAKTGRNVKASLDVIWSVYEKYRIIIQSDKLAETLKSLNKTPEIINKRIKFKYLIQEGAMPPRFILGVKGAKGLSENLKRFVENFFRMAYDFEGTPIRIRFNL
ncbi:MAG: ribosome biogenesis GTPase Der [Omnitrophica bacterium RIFCSPLOWO2_01_FULL_45_24]|nr:MAG: ribosome biogenesis GTPase Der [Omnitrophica bacterium RIFCSPHIGHO2_02_FULL_46_20]OGW93894.1 MAG: ribosome biogenesis GTPase Der [Omnitrophica bacterium RIFCSPLOWO2_01_FULL_45_24]